MALAAHSVPHFTTIADFIASRDAQIGRLFRDVLLVCDEAGLIGRQMFAVDGVKLPSNASKEWSGTKEEFAQKVQEIEHAIKVLTERHRQADASDSGSEMDQAREKQIETLNRASKKVQRFLAENEDKIGAGGRVKKSNITDNESAKMKTGKGVIQGYCGIAMVDSEHQIVVAAQAFGESQEHHLLIPMLEATRGNFRAIGNEDDVLKQSAVSADAGYHTEANMRYLIDNQIDGYVADTLFRKRDPRFANAARYKQRSQAKHFRPQDFHHDPQAKTCICPAGEFLYQNGSHCNIGGREAVKFTGAKRVCAPCDLRDQCLRKPEKTLVRQVVFFTGHNYQNKYTYTEIMKRKIDTEHGRHQYSKRLGTVEPVFANIASTKGLKRFSHRGRKKVNTQWLMYCMVHNLEKVRRYGKWQRQSGAGSG
jgi:DDE family transposase